jgi:hypothetical protein
MHNLNIHLSKNIRMMLHFTQLFFITNNNMFSKEKEKSKRYVKSEKKKFTQIMHAYLQGKFKAATGNTLIGWFIFKFYSMVENHASLKDMIEMKVLTSLIAAITAIPAIALYSKYNFNLF